MRLVNYLITFIGFTFIGCLSSTVQFTPNSGSEALAKVVVSDSVLAKIDSNMVWQGQVGGLDSMGRGGKAAGVGAYRKARIKIVGVPYGHKGDVVSLERKKRNYITDLQDSLSAKIFRTTPTLNGLFTQDDFRLARIILSWGPDNPGPYIGAIVDEFQTPIDGVGFDIEEDLQNFKFWGTTPEDLVLAKEWGLTTVKDEDVLKLHTKEIAIFCRALFYSLKVRYPECQFAVVYTAWDPKVARERHGCDWDLLTGDLVWRGVSLPPISMGMVGYGYPTIPPYLQEWAKKMKIPLFFNVQTRVTPPATEEATYRAKILNILGLPNPRVGFVDFYDEQPANSQPKAQLWGPEDERIFNIFNEYLEK